MNKGGSHGTWMCLGGVLSCVLSCIMTSTMLPRLGFIRPAVNDTRTYTTRIGTPMGERMPSAALVLLEMSGVLGGDHGTKSWQIHVWATISHPNDRRRYSPEMQYLTWVVMRPPRVPEFE